MPIDLIIRGAQVATPAGVQQRDLFIDAGRFVDTADAAKEIIDATRLTAFPGLIDSHVHFNEPGRSDWEGIATGSAALAAGGGTCFFDMPLNSSPPTLDADSFDQKLAAAKASSLTDFALWGGLTPANLDRLEELADRGVIGFKAFMCPSGIDDFQHADDDALHQGMTIAAGRGLIVAVHAESEAMTERLTRAIRARGGTAIDDYLASRPIDAETDAAERAITLAEQTGCRLHIVHVANSRSVAMVHAARARGVDVTCETCPHYLLLNTDDLHRLGAIAKCAPPLRPADVQRSLRADLLAGRFAFVASDHSPAPPAMKQSGDFFAVWGGIASVQSTLAALLSHEPPLPEQQVARLIAGGVAERFRLMRKGAIRPGMDADLTLVDLSASYTLARGQLLNRHKLSPYVGRRFRGVVRRTIVRGQTVFHDGRIVAQPVGRLVKPEAA